MSRKTGRMVFCTVFIMLMLAACGRGKEPGGSGTYLYYVSADGTTLVEKPYELRGDTPEEEMENYLKKMKKEPESIDYKSAVPADLKIQKAEFQNGRITIDFDADYTKLDSSQELLLRAALVRGLGQIAGVTGVEILVAGEPLKDRGGEPVGAMRPEDFIQNIGSSLHSYQMGDLTLYFANEKGDKLVREEVSVRYNSNMSIEKVIVEQLIKGPASEGAYPLLSEETNVLGVSVKDHICYVNLDEDFLNNTCPVDPRLTIYAIVNSIVGAGNVSEVQISVKGETDLKYMSSIDLSKPFSGDLTLVEGNE